MNEEESRKELVSYWIELTSFEQGQLEDWLKQAEEFLKAIKPLIKLK